MIIIDRKSPLIIMLANATSPRHVRACQVACIAAAILPVPGLGVKNPIPILTPGLSEQIYRKNLYVLYTARRVQVRIPVNPTRRPKVGQEDSQIHNPTMIGRNNTQTIIFGTEGSACAQLQITSSHSRFTTSAMTNPTHNTTKIKSA
ncbi:MAG: hypothetical protein WBB69_12355 [Anaerolineales bacterium]